jgi:uncharacterized protein YyaL (SSP411 family)
MRPSRSGLLGVLFAAATPVGAGSPPTLSWEAARERSARTGERVLVEVGASWCHACNVLEIRTLADSAVQRALSDGWILVEVDVDRRPDLHRLFHARGHDGLPSLHFLDSAGNELVRSGFVEPPALLALLATAGSRPPSELVPAKDAREPLSDLRALRDTLLAAEDTTNGGFSRGAKYLVTPEVDFLLALVEAGDSTAVSALRRLVRGVTASKQNREVVSETWTFLVSRLQDPATGLFHGSVNADVVSPSGKITGAGDAYYARPARIRPLSTGYAEWAVRLPPRSRSGPAPPVDRTTLADANARLGYALLLAGEVFSEPAWTEAGLRQRDRILEHLTDEEGRMLHYRAPDGSGRGGVEDLAELGILLVKAGDDASLAAAERLGRRLLDEGPPMEQIGEDGARAILFLALLAAATRRREHVDAVQRAFHGMRSANPEPDPAAVGLASWWLAQLAAPAADTAR